MKLAIIGLKGHVGVVLTGAQLLGDVELVGVSEDDPNQLASWVKKDPLVQKAQTYEQWRHLLEHSMPDVCCVADESGARIEQLLALLERDIHVVSEKPLVTTLADLERLRAAFAKSKSQLSMLLELRHQAKYSRVREFIRRGDIGEVCQVATQKSYQWGERAAWYSSRARLGGTIPFIGIHSLDIIQWVTGLDYTHVAAFQGNIGHPEIGETEDHASVLARLSNGASVTARIDYLRPASMAGHGDDRLRVVGTKGIIEVNEGDEFIARATNEKSERLPFGETENLFVEFAQHLKGGPAPRITADDCFYITEVALQARQTGDENRMIAVAPRRAARGEK